MSTKIQLYLDWIVNVQFAGVVMAQKNGLYEQKGIDLEVIPWDGVGLSTDPLSNSANGIRLATIEDNLLIKEIDQGKPLKAVAAMMQASPIGLMAKKGRFQDFPDGLKGKRIAAHIDGYAMLDLLLEQSDLHRDSVDIVTVGVDLQGFLSDEVDLMQCYAMLEPLTVMEMGHEVDIFPARNWGYDVYSQVVVATEEQVTNHPEKIMDFLDVTFEGWKLAFRSPEIVARKLIQEYDQPESLDTQISMLKELEHWVFDATKGYFRGEMEMSKWKNIVKLYQRMGMVSESVHAEGVMAFPGEHDK